MTTVFAHFGHWSTSLAFFAPVIVLPLGLYIVARRSPPPDPPDET
jgi:hypothetical protein